MQNGRLARHSSLSRPVPQGLSVRHLRMLTTLDMVCLTAVVSQRDTLLVALQVVLLKAHAQLEKASATHHLYDSLFNG